MGELEVSTRIMSGIRLCFISITAIKNLYSLKYDNEEKREWVKWENIHQWFQFQFPLLMYLVSCD